MALQRSEKEPYFVSCVKLALASKLKHEENALLVVEVAVEAEHRDQCQVGEVTEVPVSCGAHSE